MSSNFGSRKIFARNKMATPSSPTRSVLVKKSPSTASLMDFSHSNLSTCNQFVDQVELGENAVWVRDAAKGIGRTLTKMESPRSIMILAKMQGFVLFLLLRTRIDPVCQAAHKEFAQEK
jgi:hypothetical protein